MKAQADATGKQAGFQKPDDGWHLCTFDEGIGLVLNAEQKEILSKKGDRLWKIPLKIDDPEDPNNELGVDILAYEDDRGEKTFSNMLGVAGLFESFAKAYPKDTDSVFEDRIMDKVKSKLIGKKGMFYTSTKEDKKGVERCNVIAWAPASLYGKQKELDEVYIPKVAGAKSGGKAKPEASTESKGPDEDF
jgi:hypothetical protein